uniref:Uncharacterized protein n=1 Tax=Panagrolaimus superbus TaxID=310955 RepID=A0A914Z024_9BILA
METLGGINYKILVCYAIAWIITAICLRKGVKLVGKLAYFTATVPYAIIAILFVRSITLDGAKTGMDYFILKPDFSRIFDPTVLRNAASHICYSLSIGFGGMISMASYNPSHHNPYATAATLTIADGLMSLFGGLSVFSVLGFMSKQLNVPIDEVIQSGTGLAFVAYPEAMSRLPLPWLWSFLFFVMIWILGVSTQFGFVETSFALMVMLFAEIILVCHVYGIKNYIYDLRSMLGNPKTKFAEWFGPTGYYPAFIWTVISPIVCVIIFVLALMTQITHNMTYGKGSRIYVYPDWSIAFGWSWRELFRLQPKWPSYSRHQINGTGGTANSGRVGIADPHQSVPKEFSSKQQTEV